MRAALVFAALMLFAVPGIAGADAPVLSSQRDYSVDSERDAPIACKDGDISPFRGQTMAEVFGADWPQYPQAASPGTRQPARALMPGRLTPPRGLTQRATVVVATLVGSDGMPLRSEVICTTSLGVDMAAKRSAKTARFEPASVDGRAVVSVVTRVYVFQPSTLRMPPAGAD